MTQSSLRSDFARACLAALPLLTLGCSAGNECQGYVDAKIADLRAARGSGCFELRDVVVVARTPSQTAPRLYVQDAAGGDFSAIMAKCADSAKHPCSGATAQQLVKLLDGAGVTLRGYYAQGSQSGFEELYIDSVVDSGSFLPFPAPAVLEPADLAKTARRPAHWFQAVSVTVPAGDPWLIADLSPPELALGSACPRWAGFAMAPASQVATAPADCSNGENPPSLAQAPVGEILIGRQFYDGFWASSDCACALDHKQHLLSAYESVVGQLGGILILEQMQGVTVQILEPVSKLGFPVSGG